MKNPIKMIRQLLTRSNAIDELEDPDFEMGEMLYRGIRCQDGVVAVVGLAEQYRESDDQLDWFYSTGRYEGMHTKYIRASEFTPPTMPNPRADVVANQCHIHISGKTSIGKSVIGAAIQSMLSREFGVSVDYLDGATANDVNYIIETGMAEWERNMACENVVFITEGPEDLTNF